MTTDPTRRRFLQIAGASGAIATLTGCDALTDSVLGVIAPETGLDLRPPDADTIDEVTHVLNRLTWGARPGDYRRVRTMGVQAFIDEQLHPEQLTDRRCDWKCMSIESVHEPTGELYEHNDGQLLLDMTRYKLLRGVFSRRQLFEVMVDFWTDHFNIVSEKGDCRWLKLADDRDVIRQHALGNFRDLVRASATSPAMLIYLDGHDNRVEHEGDRPNENYARELLELHTLGVHGGYTQRDVMEVARCLSGWTYQHSPFRFRPAHVEFSTDRHDDGEKIVLGERIAAGGGADDLERVIDIVCQHPSTARYIAEKLCRRFIADDPPADAVATVAAAFTSAGGDVRPTLRALFATTAFVEQRGQLLKRPLRYVLSTLRATDATTNCGPGIVDVLGRMGHAPFQYPTPDGYPMDPEPWLGTLLWRWNFALDLVGGRIGGSSVDEAALETSVGGRAALAAHVVGRRASDDALAIYEASSSPLGVMLCCPEFQWH